MTNRLIVNRPKAKLMGVCAGLADWLAIDVLVIRLLVIAATFFAGPVALLLYILTGWLASDDR